MGNLQNGYSMHQSSGCPGLPSHKKKNSPGEVLGRSPGTFAGSHGTATSLFFRYKISENIANLQFFVKQKMHLLRLPTDKNIGRAGGVPGLSPGAFTGPLALLWVWKSQFSDTKKLKFSGLSHENDQSSWGPRALLGYLGPRRSPPVKMLIFSI